jgi:arginine-tRNA-protein transferase
MDHDDPEAFLAFLTARWAETTFFEFRLEGALLAVAVVDRMEDALSAVYTFFDPDRPERSLGRYAVLYEIAAAKDLGLRWLYLGYWIRDCRKMRYKDEFQPLEAYSEGRWVGLQGQ